MYYAKELNPEFSNILILKYGIDNPKRAHMNSLNISA
jgi:hypothetical protein